MSADDDDSTPKPPLAVSRSGKPLGDYQIGYGRPPVGTRFTATNNPGGRRKGSKNMRTLLQQKLDEKVPVRIGGKTKKMSKRELGLSKAVNRFAAEGGLKDMVAMDRIENAFSDRYGEGRSAAAPAAESMADQARRKAVLDWCFQARMQAQMQAQQALDADNAAADPGKTGEADETDEADSTTGDDDHDDRSDADR